jgi:hypothetical protein
VQVEPWIFLIVIVVLGVLFYLAQRFGWIDLSNKSKTSGSGGIAGIGDEVFHPTRHEAQIEMDRQTVLPAPAPLPGDGDKGIYDGQVRIDLTKPGKHAAE